MSNKIDKNDLKGPDAFQSTTEKIFEWIEKHAVTMASIAGLLVVLGIGYAGYGFMSARAERKAADALYGPQAELKKAETTLRDERAKKMQDLAGLTSKDKKQVKPESVRPADYALDFAPAVTKVKAQIKEYGNTKVALVAALNLSYFLLQQKQFSEALAVLDLPTYRPSSGDILAGFWNMHRGLVELENQKFDEAAKSYQSVIDARDLKAFHPEAMLKLGVTFEQKGDAEKARQTYEKLGKEFPESEASSSGRQYLRLLDLKSQKG